MSDLESQFKAAVDKVQNAPKDGSFKPSNDYKLKMYALFKQATVGNVQGKKPGMLDVIGRAKYKAWASSKGLPKDAAMQAYIAEVAGVESEHG